MLIYAYVKNGVYKYIGQTKNLKQRRYMHEIWDPFHSSSNSYNSPLSRGIRKYGADAYEVVILEDNIQAELIDEREIYWIDYYNTCQNGYNCTTGGKRGSSYIIYNEDIINIVKSLLKQQVPAAQIKEITGVSLPHISGINHGKKHYDANETYPLNAMTQGRLLTKQQVIEIKDLLKNSRLNRALIGKRFGVSKAAILSIDMGKTHYDPLESYPIRKPVQTNN